jgi:hypothetical protein
MTYILGREMRIGWHAATIPFAHNLTDITRIGPVTSELRPHAAASPASMAPVAVFAKIDAPPLFGRPQGRCNRCRKQQPKARGRSEGI